MLVSGFPQSRVGYVSPTLPDDSTLARRATAGDTGAFEHLVTRHGPVAHRVALRIVGPDEADDVTQDAFLRAYHRLGQFRGDRPFRAWLLRIVHNAALDAQARRRPDAVDPQEHDETDVRARGPAAALEDRERRDRLAFKLTELRDEHRTVLVLRDLEGMPYDEIAAVTEAPIGSVKGRLHRARKEMIELLRNNTYDWELPQ